MLEIGSDGPLISTVEDATDLIGNLYGHDFDAVLVHREQFGTGFFDLKTGLAGEVLQKFSNYRIRLFIAGTFSDIQSNSLRDFIRESNKRKQVNFVATVDEALLLLHS